MYQQLEGYAHSKLGQKWRPGLFWAEIDHFGDMDNKFILPNIFIDIKGKPSWKSIGPKLTTFSL